MDNVAQSFRSNQFRPPSPVRPQQSAKSSDGTPLLKRHRIEFNPDESITHLAAGRNQVVVATRDRKIEVVDITSSNRTNCDLARYLGNRLMQARLQRVFIDPTGKFVIISLAYAADNQPMENLLFVKRLQPLPRLKNHLISCVAWNYPKTNSDSSNSNSTGTILLGTSKGLVLQTELIYSDETKFFPLSSSSRQYVKEIFDVGPDMGAITGLECHQIPSDSSTEKSFKIFVSTSSRLYRLQGSVPANADPLPLHLIFAQSSTNYKDVPGKFNNSKLDFYYSPSNKPPERFAWLTEPGVMTGEISNKLSSDPSASNDDISIIPYEASKENEQLMSTSTPARTSPPFSSMATYYYEKPISLVVTKFHVIILFRHCIKAICILNEVTVYEEHFSSKHGHILGMCKDPTKNIIWVYSENAVFRYKMSNEDKNVWKIYLEQKKFDLAKKYSANDENNYDRVFCEEAQHYFKLKEYEESAKKFAVSRKAFEEVALMFMEIKHSKALRKYLTIKSDQFDPSQVTQATMTLAWLLELIVSSISVIQTRPITGENSRELDELNNELDKLLENKRVVDCFKHHSKLFYGIIRNYSDSTTFIKLAKLVRDYEAVVQYYMDLGDFQEALEIMKTVENDRLFYAHGHIIMKSLPKELVDALIDRHTIMPSKLIPILIQENPYHKQCSQTIRYLEHAINILKTDSKVIHTHLFELYAKYRDEETLINYLESQLSDEEAQQCRLDLQLCLRLCTGLKLTKTCVKLYSAMELYDEALNLALDIDIELAKEIASKPESEETQKRLWLAIGENVCRNNLDIGITNLLRECKLLKIEDILPFFPNNTTIDHFKESLRQSLFDYKNQLLLLRDGTYDHIADEIKNEIKAFRNRYSILKADLRCEICDQNLTSRAYHVFPCGHLFHSECIIAEVISIDPSYKGIEDKLKQLSLDTKTSSYHAKQQSLVINSVSSQTKATAVDNNSRELDQIISSECIYCGSLLLSSINKPPPFDLDQLSCSD